ncbi:glycosyl hydrolases family 35-domain-containing protein [Chytridium lagenaria]|nr:glycosyl hydrolases family 35-domain-containing protein [Chytridium lagenaria]
MRTPPTLPIGGDTKEPLITDEKHLMKLKEHGPLKRVTPPQDRRATAKAMLVRAVLLMGVLVVYSMGRKVVVKTLHAGTSPWLTEWFGWPKTHVPRAPLTNITYDHRSLLINGKRELLFTGAIHYPRSSVAMWPSLMQRSKEAGINAIDTYVFWNLHEQEEGVYDFTTDNGNLTLFLDKAKEAGLYVVLRIGPYVCAEWTFGGFPFWLMEKPGMELRNYNADFMESMEKFVRKTLDVVRPYLFQNGGPIVLLQMENEFGAIEAENGVNGHRYITWAADLANSLDVGIPWIMCVQDNMPTVINTGNGFYSDNWISEHWKRFPDQPAFFTELWTGWFQQWTQPKWTRPAEDVAFSAARFVARGGSYVAYYMWHGGTNFGRWGSAWKTASYDYDAPLNEYGFPNNPKYGLLKALHEVVLEHKEVLLNHEGVMQHTGGQTEMHVYGDMKDYALVFLSNYNAERDETVLIDEVQYVLPRWSVSIYTAKNAHHTRVSTRQHPEMASAHVMQLPKRIAYLPEPIGTSSFKADVVFDAPLEQTRVTKDKSDYLWYIRPNVTVEKAMNRWMPLMKGESGERHWFRMRRFSDVVSVWVDGVRVAGSVVSVSGEEDGMRVEVPEGVAILAGVMGLENCCGHLERVEKGVLGAVYLDDVDVTFGGNWLHRVGLWGEAEKIWEVKESQNWISEVPSAYTPMVWYRLTFSRKALVELADQAMATASLAHVNAKTMTFSKPLLSAFSLHLGTMGRGQAYVNGRAVGRHWSVEARWSEQCGGVAWRDRFGRKSAL